MCNSVLYIFLLVIEYMFYYVIYTLIDSYVKMFCTRADVNKKDNNKSFGHQAYILFIRPNS